MKYLSNNSLNQLLKWSKLLSLHLALIMLSYGLQAQTIDFSASSTTAACGPFTVQFTPQVTVPVDSFFWDFGDGGTSLDSSPVHIYTDPGNYSVSLTVKDSGSVNTYNTTKTGYIQVDGPRIIEDGVGVTHTSCSYGTDGSVNVLITNGQAPYTTVWYVKDTFTGIYTDTFSTDTDLLYAYVGDYKLHVTDATGCTTEREFEVHAYQEEPRRDSFHVGMHASCNPGGDGDGVLVLDRLNPLPGYRSWFEPLVIMVSNLGVDMNAGVYDLITADSQSVCVDTFSFEVYSVFTNDTVVTDHSDKICGGSANGKAWVVNANANYPFAHTIEWSNGDVGDTARNLAAGTYQVSVIDDTSGCIAFNEVVIEAYDPIEVHLLDEREVLCANIIGCIPTGQLLLNTSGGVPPYSYEWWYEGSMFDTTECLFNALSGTYRLDITDSLGCMYSYTHYLDSTNAPLDSTKVFVVSDTAFYCGPAEVDLHVWGTGDVMATYWFAFSTGDTLHGPNVTYTFDQPGSYDVTFHGNYDLGAQFDTTIYGMINVYEPTIDLVSMSALQCRANSFPFGDIDIDISNAEPGYTIEWYEWDTTALSRGDLEGNTEDLYNVDYGAYIVRVTNPSGCYTESVFVLEPSNDPLVLDIGNQPVVCNGEANAKAWANITGGEQPYSYTWSTGSITDTIDALAPGVYMVSVVDRNNCWIMDSVTITDPPVLAIDTLDMRGTSCATCADGFVSVDVSGGVQPYQYAWSNGVTTFENLNVGAGSYTVTVTDNNGCSVQQSFSVVLVNCEFTASATTAGCGPFTVQFTPQVTVPVDSFFWDFGDGGTSSDSSPVHIYTDPGTYHVSLGVVESGTGQFYDTIKSNYISLGGVVIAQTSLVLPLCYGTASGEIEVKAIGGVDPYSFIWYQQDTMTGTYGTLSYTDSVATNLPAGIYKVEVSDANGCVNDRVFDLLTAAPDEIVVTLDVEDESCSPGNDGKAWVEQVIGGTAPFDYTWSPGGQNDTIDSLESSYYTLTITDWNGCTATANTFVDSMRLMPDPQLDMTHPVCNGDTNGKAWIVDAATTYPFAHTISWSNGNVGDTATNLIAGNYVVTITETSTGCSTNESFSLTEPPALSVDILQAFDPICLLFNCFAGGVYAGVSGGTEPYYNASGTALLDANDLSRSNVGQGTFSFTVSDVNGCVASNSVTLPSAGTNLTGNFTTSQRTSLCGPLTVYFHAFNMGTLFEEHWFSFDGDTIHSESVAYTFTQPGTYNFTYHSITDPAGYRDTTIVGTIQILEPSVNIVSQQDATCGNSDGYIDIDVINVSSNYTVTWSRWDNFMFTWVHMYNGFTAQTEDLLNVPAGTYQLDIQDSLGCSYQQTFTINDRGMMSLSMDIDTPTCVGFANAVAKVNVTGGVEPYNYIWSTGEVTQSISGLASGSYAVTVIDSSGCSASRSFSITDPDPLVATMDQSPASFSPGNFGLVWVEVSGGVPPYTYTWASGLPIGPNGDTVLVTPGLCSVTVTDNSGCMITDTITCGMDCNLIDPILDSTHIDCSGAGMAKAWVVDAASMFSYQPNYSWSDGSNGDTMYTNTPGVYYLTITDPAGYCSVVDSVHFNDPLAYFVTNMQKTDASCSPGADGTAWCTISAMYPVFYEWSTGATGAGASNTDTITGLSAGTYQITVTDANGCVKVDSVTVQASGAGGPVVALNTVSDVSCFGGNNGYVNVTITGGAFPYTYVLSGSGMPTTVNNNAPFDVTGLAVGNYTMTVTDNAGCSNNLMFVITEPQQITTTMSKVDASCSPGFDGEASVLASGGTTPYSYNWDNRSMSAFDTIMGLNAGMVNVEIIDMNGCSAIDSIMINTSGPGQLDMDSMDIRCFGAGNGKAWVTDAATLYPTFTSYQWSNSSSSDTLYTSVPGTFFVTLTDVSGTCSMIDSVTINEPDSMYLVVDQIVDATCSTCDDGEVYFSNFGGTLSVPWGYAYQWSNGNTTQDQTGLPPGPYGITITDENGCSIDTTVIVGYGHLCQSTLDLGNDTTVCDPFFIIDHNLNVGSIYIHLWNTGEMDSVITVNMSGTYHLYSTDTFGCADHDSILVTFATPAITSAIGDTLICDGGNAQLAATGGISYNWSPATGLSSPTLANPSASPSSPEFYTVTITDANGCITTHDVLVDVDTSCVWPGDANLDGIANNDDVLTIGLFYGQSGLARPNASVVWEAQPLPSDLSLYPNWPLLKHADCNGDATIDNLDTNAITVNYGLTHPKTEGEARRFVDPLLYFVLPDSTPAGQVADIDVMLGDATLPANNAYGIIFSINYDNTIVADTPFVLNTSGSWLGMSSTDMLAYKHNLYSNSRVDVALTRTDGVVRSGFGKLGTVSMTMKDDISGKDYLAVDMDLTFSNIKLVDNQGNIIPIVSEDGVLRVYDPSTSINTPVLMNSLLRVYPNPSTGDLFVEVPGELIEEVRVLNIVGQEMLNMYAGINLVKLDIADFNVGTYFVQVKVDGHWLNQKVILTDQ